MLNYNDYTKRNHVLKALRLELIPQGKTLETIEAKGDKEYDKALYESLDRMKPVIDSFIRDVADKALSDLKYDFSALYKAKAEKNRKAADKEEKALTKEIISHVEDALPDGMRLSQINSAKFLQVTLREYVLNTNDTSFDKAQALKDIDAAKGCHTLFSKFLKTRITSLSVWMPERVIENLDIYSENMKIAMDVKESADASFSDYTDALTLAGTIDYYSSVLSQKDIDGYNSFISGVITEEGTQQKGLNQLINEYNQRTKNEKLDRTYIKRLKPLYKQILIPQEKKFSILSIGTDEEVRSVLKEAYKRFCDYEKPMTELILSKGLCGDGIYVQGNKLHPLSHLLSGDHNLIPDRMIKKESAEINEMLQNGSLKASMKKELEKRLEILGTAISKGNYELTELNEYVKSDDKSSLSSEKTAYELYVNAYKEAVAQVKMYYKIIEGGDILTKRRIKGDRHVQEMLVDFFSSLTDVRNILSIIQLPKGEENGDISFYNEYDELSGEIRATYKAENLVRNYITKSVNEIAIEKQTCLGTPARLRAQWWNGEKKFSKEHTAIIKHEDRYYYFILAGDSKPVDIKVDENSDTEFLTMKKGQDSYMMFPKILFSNHAAPFFEANKDASEYVFDDKQVTRPLTVSKEVYEIYKKGYFKKDAVKSGTISEDEYKSSLKLIMQTYLDFANAYVQYEKFDLSEITDLDGYADVGEFFSDIDTHTSNMSWTHIDYSQIESLVENGLAYMFLINNKQLYTDKEKKDPYPKAFLTLLSDENMEKTTMLLNSNPAIYFRPQVLEKKITHKKGSILVDRLTAEGKPIPKRIYEAIYKLKNNIPSIEKDDIEQAEEYMRHNTVKTKRADVDKYYKKSFMSDKYIMQLTYTKNNDVSDRQNDMLNDRIKESISEGCYILSISRSVKDMAYIMVLDDKLNVLEERSLNTIDGIDYFALLHDAYEEKKENKKLWVYDTESADLKSAYIDHAITEILKTAYKYNAVIAIESISDTVKDKYAFIDNQVFKAFENRLAERLSDLSFKDIENGRAGSINNPLQLSNNSGNSYQDGVLFFMNGAYTRGIDPETGFTTLFDFGRINSISSKRQFFSKMESITYDGETITFTFDYKNYPVKYDTDKSKWTVILSGDADIYDREKKTTRHVSDVISKFIIPAAGGVDLNGNLAEKILGKEVSGAFVEELYKWFRYSLAGMHRNTKDHDEFYRSPINGKTYDISSSLAYNLAKKLVFRLEYAGEPKDFTKEWLNYLQA